ncbi:MAG: metallophosphoesterase [Luteolibacter sp.]
MMRLPVRIFSDLHLGHKASRIDGVEALMPLFEGAGTVVFNGDTWEELSESWREKSGEMLDRLRELLDTAGIDTVFLPGNHDPGWDGLGFIELAGGKVVVSHGDALLRDGAPWKREMLAGRVIVDGLWEQFPAADTDPAARHELARAIAKRMPTLHAPEGRSLFSRIVDAAFPPLRPWNMLKTWIGYGGLGATFCETYFPDAEILVTGHFHCRGIRKSRGKIVLNTGSFVVPGPAAWVEWDGETLSMGAILETKNGFAAAGANPIRRFVSETENKRLHNKIGNF